MPTYKVEGLDAFAKLFAKHQKNREARIVGAARKAARKTLAFIDENTIPVAFDELRGSGEVKNVKGGARIIFDARHAAAVEVGSRPHWMPLEPLIAWVKLRGMQGLSKGGRVRKKTFKNIAGTTTARHARAVAAELRALEEGGALGIDAPEKVARAIQAAIAKHGTHPHWFARKALPAARAYLAEFIAQALAEAD